MVSRPVGETSVDVTRRSLNASPPPRRRLLVSWLGFVPSVLAQLVLVFLGLSYITAPDDSSSLILLVAWCVVGTVYVLAILVVLSVRSRRPALTARPVLLEIHLIARIVALCATVLASCVGVVAALQHIFVRPEGVLGALFDIAGVWAMLLSWGLFHWGFTQAYLQLYYRATRAPMRFPDTPFPGLVEFAYFAFTTAVSFAASDVEVLTARLRWQAVVQSVMSFFFNGLIIVVALGIITSPGSAGV